MRRRAPSTAPPAPHGTPRAIEGGRSNTVVSRYCVGCGNELAEDGAFCANCGRPVSQTARVSTPQADVQAPPPPHPQQAGSPARAGAGYAWLVFMVLGFLAIFVASAEGESARDLGTLMVFIGTVWVVLDIRDRGMSGWWPAGVLFLFIPFFPLYFFKRRPKVRRS